jgi:ADP-heptose:LPS heptosyltransferase
MSCIADQRALAAALRGCQLFVGNDGGVMHLAASVGVPCVAVFGLSNHRAWGPYPPVRHRVVRLDLECSPCFYPAFGLGTPHGCAARTCLMELAPISVLEAARDLLSVSERAADADEPVT